MPNKISALCLALCILLMCSCDKEINSSENNQIISEAAATTTQTTSIQTAATTSQASTTTTSQATTSIQTERTSAQAVTQNEVNNFVLPENAKLVSFFGIYEYDKQPQKLQTTDSYLINNFIYELNRIEYTSSEKTTISGGGNWAEGYWDINIYKDGKALYHVHAERNAIYIIDNTIADATNNCTIITVSDDIRHNFENKVFNINDDGWEKYVDYFCEYLTEAEAIDSFGKTSYSEASYTVYVATEDFSEYKTIESKYSDFHSFPEIKYESVKYSQKEMKEAAAIIKEQGAQYSAYVTIIDIQNSKISVYMTEANEDYKTAIIALSPIKDLKLIVSDEYLVQENPTT